MPCAFVFRSRLNRICATGQLFRKEYSMNEIEQLMYNTRRFLTSVAACVLGLLLIFAPAYAQTVAQKKTIQKQSTITQAEVTKTQLDSVTVTDNSRAAIRPFRINIPEAELVDLRRRVLATRWPDRETVSDHPGRATGEDPGTRALLGN